jgi:putative ABC transport system permease protein
LEAVILKTLGATQRRIMLAHSIEYLLLALLAAVLAVGLGALAAWVAVTQVMDIPFTFSIAAVLQSLLLAIGLVVIFGGAGTWAVLRARPAAHLKSE